MSNVRMSRLLRNFKRKRGWLTKMRKKRNTSILN